MTLTRRQLFAASGLSLAGIGLARSVTAHDATGFTHGVASGEPGARSMLLWTRYRHSAPAQLNVELARLDDPDFRRPVAGGETTASPDSHWCAKLTVSGLEPATDYLYRFVARDGTISQVGRTRTLPEGPADRFRMAVFSCSNFGFGWFNAYAHAVEDDAFDLAVHLGDFLYEYGSDNYPDQRNALAGRHLSPDYETVTLADYRARHATYRRDLDLQALMARYPLVAIWDDHESTNDSWKDGAENHQPDSEGDWQVRKAAAKRAYREWMPVSDAPYATYEIGDLASLYRLDTRLEGRDEPPSLGKVLEGKADPASAFAALSAFRNGDWRDPARQMLGAQQEKWLYRGLASSAASGTKWQVLAQQVVMGSLKTAGSVLDAITDETPGYVRRRLQASAAASAAGLPFNMDAWDGYPAARDRLLAAALEADANLVVLAGDSHNAWASDLDLAGERVGVEFAGHSVTSPGAERSLAAIAPADLARQSVAANPQLRWADTSQRGYMAVELTPSMASSEYRFMETIRARTIRLAGTHRLAARHGERRLDA